MARSLCDMRKGKNKELRLGFGLQHTSRKLGMNWIHVEWSREGFWVWGPVGSACFPLHAGISIPSCELGANTGLWDRVCLTLQITKLSALRIFIPFQQHQQVFCEYIHSSLNIICQSPDTCRFCTSFINFSYLTTCKLTKSYPPRSQNPTPNPLSRQKALLINRKQQPKSNNS
jgi:hypothetical protein